MTNMPKLYASDLYRKTGNGHFMNLINSGFKANKNIGGITMLFEGLINYSITGDIFYMNLANASSSSFLL